MPVMGINPLHISGENTALEVEKIVVFWILLRRQEVQEVFMQIKWNNLFAVVLMAQ